MRFPSKLDRVGFVTEGRCARANSGSLLEEFLEFSRQSVCRIARISPRTSSEARENTLSSQYGLGEFPLHSDFSTDQVPPRYIGLFCPVSRSAATHLFAAEDVTSSIGTKRDSALFRIATGRRSFSARFRTNGPDGFAYRYNADCMMPVNDDAKEVAQAMKAHFEPTYSIDWGVCSMVVFDNWRFFHMRGKSPEDDRGWLWRIAVWSSK
jgi:hypothetical protein